jgi:hypothetical protein
MWACIQELQKLVSEERMAKERLSDEVHALKSRALSEESARGSRSVQEVRYRYIGCLNIGESMPSSHVLTLRSPHVGRAQYKRYGTGTLAA